MQVAKANRGILAATIASALCIGAAVGWDEVKSNPANPAEVKNVQEMSRVFRDVAKSVRPAVVTITTMGKPVKMDRGFGGIDENSPFGEFFRGRPELREFFRDRPQAPHVPRGTGSGFVIDSKGVILTNSHVVRDADEVIVHFIDGREARATEIKADPRTDIAIIRIDPKEVGKLEAIPTGDSDKTDVGDWVLAVGSPFGLDMTVTAGIISAKGRGIHKTHREDYLQTDAAINPGNSGGPLLNLNGQVIGINTAISSRSGGYEGIGFAIPINMAKWVADQLIVKGEVRRAYLGTVIQPVEGTMARVLKLEPGQGAIVNSVFPKSPAEKAGLKSHDVVLDFDGQKIAGPKDLQAVVEKMQVGKTYNMSVVRDGKQMTLPVTVEEMPKDYGMARLDASDEDEQAEPQSPKDSSIEDLGIELRELTPEVAESLKLKDAKGVVVSSVKPGSLGDKAGLREGLLITRVDQKPVSSIADFEKVYKSASLKKGIILDVQTRMGNQLLAIQKG